MKRAFIFVIISVYSCYVNGQSNNRIIGKWQIVAMNNGVSYNYKTDSLFVTKKLRDSLAGRKDSAVSVEMLSMFVTRYADYQFVFDDQLKFQEISKGKLRVSGIYKLNPATQSIRMTYGTEGNNKPHEFKYSFEGSNLKLHVSSPFGEELEFTLEKLE